VLRIAESLGKRDKDIVKKLGGCSTLENIKIFSL